MKKVLFSISAFAMALGFTACSSEDSLNGNGSQKSGVVTFSAYTESATSTRTSLDGNDHSGYQVVWSENDKIGEMGSGFIFTLKEGAGTTAGIFEGNGKINENGSYYYGVDMDLLSAGLPMWPAIQSYKENNFSDFPMFGTPDGEDKQSLKFTNLGGLLRLAVKGDATVKNIAVSATEYMAGHFSISPEKSAYILDNSSQKTNSITLDCGLGVALDGDGVDFYIAMPANIYTGVKVTLTDTESKVCTKTFKGTNGLAITRSQITKASFTASDFKSPVTYKAGDLVTLDGHDGIVVDINGTLVAVATMNVGAESVDGSNCIGTKMSHDEACAWSGWRLPTVDEMETFCSIDYPGVCGTTDWAGNAGVIAWNIDDDDEPDLFLPLNDYDEEYPYDRYWTGTADGGDTYYYFAPEIDWENDYSPLRYEDRWNAPYKEAVAKSNTCLVRLFHDLP